MSKYNYIFHDIENNKVKILSVQKSDRRQWKVIQSTGACGALDTGKLRMSILKDTEWRWKATGFVDKMVRNICKSSRYKWVEIEDSKYAGTLTYSDVRFEKFLFDIDNVCKSTVDRCEVFYNQTADRVKIIQSNIDCNGKRENKIYAGKKNVFLTGGKLKETITLNRWHTDIARGSKFGCICTDRKDSPIILTRLNKNIAKYLPEPKIKPKKKIKVCTCLNNLDYDSDFLLGSEYLFAGYLGSDMIKVYNRFGSIISIREDRFLIEEVEE